MRVAIIHDWLTSARGGERVLEVFCELFPDADIFTLVHKPGSVSRLIESRKIKTSFVNYLPFAATRYRYYLPLFPCAAESFNLKGYDLVISSSHCVAKGVKHPPSALHISYIYTPMRYVWDMFNVYFSPARHSWPVRKAIGMVAGYLRRWDVETSSRVDHFVSISHYVAERVKRHYGRDSDVIYPPVDCARFVPAKTPSDYFLIVSAFAPYKRIDLAIDAFSELKATGLKLKIIGTGQDEAALKASAGENVEFLGWKSDDEIAGYYAGCIALIFPGEEDFGIVPLEAMASGTPVIAFAKGGALETVIGGKTGLFFNEQTVDSLVDAIRGFIAVQKNFDPAFIRSHAMKFDRTVFKASIKSYIDKKYSEFVSKRAC